MPQDAARLVPASAGPPSLLGALLVHPLLASRKPAAPTLPGLKLGRQLVARRLAEAPFLLGVDPVGRVEISRAACS